MDKWVCQKCGREATERPYKNQICNKDGCKGRFKRLRLCKCGEWFHAKDEKTVYCSSDCTAKENHKVTLRCACCGKEFERHKGNVKNTNKAFCSKECLDKYRETLHEDRICKHCGKKFSVISSTIRSSNASGNFCSRKCYNEYQKTLTGEKNNHYTRRVVYCPTCGEQFTAIPSKMAEYKNVFCSWVCKCKYHKNYVGGEKNVNWKGGTSRYRGDFEEVKREHFFGIKWCAACGTTKGIHIHHIIPYRLSADNSVDNLIPLCRKHHKQIEHATLEFIESFGEGEYDTAKMYMNNILRSMQMTTAQELREIVKNG